MTIDNIFTFVAAILGSGGIAAVITSSLQARKYRAEAKKIEAEAESARKESDIKLHKGLQDLADVYKKESEELREQNKELTQRVNELNRRFDDLMHWIIVDNGQYVSWLEEEVRKYDPDIEFPKCKPAPGVDTPNVSDT